MQRQGVRVAVVFLGLGAALAAVAIPVAAHAAPPPRFVVTDVGLLAGFGTFGTALNSHGQVVGSAQMSSTPPHSEPSTHAFLYSDGTTTDLGPGNAYVGVANAISDAGQIVGYARDFAMGPSWPWVWAGSTPIRLNPFGVPLLFANGVALDVNGAGQIVGTATAPDFQGHAFIATADGSRPTVDLHVEDAVFTSSEAMAINNLGDVIGETRRMSIPYGSRPAKPFLYTAGQVLDLSHVDFGFPDEWFTPTAINDALVIVGFSVIPDVHPVRAAVYDYGSRAFQLLGTLGGDNSWGYGVNEGGWVVGSAETSTGAIHPFLWIAGTMHDLNDLLVQNPGVELTYGSAINDVGQIVARGRYTGDTSNLTHSFLLTLAKTPEELVNGLKTSVKGLGLPKGTENSLTSKLDGALACLAADDIACACGSLKAFINEIEAQSGKKIPSDVADQLIAEATEIRIALDC